MKESKRKYRDDSPQTQHKKPHHSNSRHDRDYGSNSFMREARSHKNKNYYRSRSRSHSRRLSRSRSRSHYRDASERKEKRKKFCCKKHRKKNKHRKHSPVPESPDPDHYNTKDYRKNFNSSPHTPPTNPPSRDETTYTPPLNNRLPQGLDGDNFR